MRIICLLYLVGLNIFYFLNKYDNISIHCNLLYLVDNIEWIMLFNYLGPVNQN